MRDFAVAQTVAIFVRGNAMCKVYQEASNVEATDGIVLVDGPGGVSVALTPDAAAETSDRLLNAAVMAQGQQHVQRVAQKEHEARHSPK